MSAKSRQKQKPFWTIELLPHSFEKTVDTPFQTCVDRMKGLEEHWRDVWRPSNYKAQLRGTPYDHYNFEIAIRSYSSRYYPYRETGITAFKCVGTVFNDNQVCKTIVRGRFTLELRTPMFLSIAFPVVLVLLAVPLNYVAEIFALVIGLFCVVMVLLDYINFQATV